jgi:hypothetical protein
MFSASCGAFVGCAVRCRVPRRPCAPDSSPFVRTLRAARPGGHSSQMSAGGRAASVADLALPRRAWSRSWTVLPYSLLHNLFRRASRCIRTYRRNGNRLPTPGESMNFRLPFHFSWGCVLLPLLSTACAPTPPSASLSPESPVLSGPHLLTTPDGRVEIIGLKTWTAEELEEAVRQYAPEESLFSSGCQAILQDSLGFPAASVRDWISEPERGERVEELLITVVEPQDSARVQYRPVPTDALPLRSEWDAALTPFRNERGLFLGGFMNGLQFYGWVAGGQPETAHQLVDGRRGAAESIQLWDFLQSQRSEAARITALWTLQHDGNEDNRMLATAILANFQAEDESWWAVLDALRDESERVRQTAEVTLRALLQSGAREVNWAPAASTIRHLLNGTNVSAFQSVLHVLTQTRIDPALVRSVLPGSKELLLAHLQAEHEATRRAARDLVAHASGRDFGSDPEPWLQWVISLQ